MFGGAAATFGTGKHPRADCAAQWSALGNVAMVDPWVFGCSGQFAGPELFYWQPVAVAEGTMKIWLQIDATPGNLAGRAGLGLVIRQDDGAILRWAMQQAPADTNNVAEYQALVHGLRLVQRYYPQANVICLTDSLLIVDHLAGRCAVRTPHLHPLHSPACQLISRCVSFRVVHIRRAYNRLADALAWEALSGTKALVQWVNTPQEHLYE